jgi:hypothetical protein
MNEDDSNIVEIYSFKENIEHSSKLKKLHRMLIDFKNEEEQIIGKNVSTKKSQQDNRTYYMNSSFRNILSS